MPKRYRDTGMDRLKERVRGQKRLAQFQKKWGKSPKRESGNKKYPTPRTTIIGIRG
jgi:hypothetical protein